MRHRLKAHREGHVHVARSHRLVGFLKAQPAGCPTAFHTMRGLRHQAEIILHHDAGHQLASEVVGEIGNHRAIDNLEKLGVFDANVIEHVVIGLFHQRGESLIRPRFGKFTHPPGNCVHGSHEQPP